MYGVVVIDDDRQVLRSMEKSIPWTEMGTVCLGVAGDGREGLRLIGELSPDIVITDIYMPVMDGLEMIRELRRQGYPGKIVILSGYSEFEYARQALKLQVDDYLSKPASLTTIREVIGQAVRQLQEERREKETLEQLEQKISHYETFLEQEWLKNVMTGARSVCLSHGGEDEALFLRKHPRLETDAHLVLGVEIAASSRISEAAPADRQLFRFAIRNVLGELLQTFWGAFEMVDLHAHHVAVLLHADPRRPQEAAVDDAIRLGKRLIRTVYEVLRIRLRIGVGTLQHDWRRISLSTEEAFLALANEGNAACGDVELYIYRKPEDGIPDLSIQKLKPIRFYHELAEAIRLFQEQRATDVIGRFIRTLEDIGETKPASLRMHGRECLTIIRFTLFDTGKNMEHRLSTSGLEKRLETVDTPETLERWLMDVVEQVCREETGQENLRHKQAVEYVLQYIQEHYAEDLTLSELAGKVYLSRNYLSQLFREYVGESFNQYVTKVRMEKAKRLLAEGKYLIYEVADMVGYKNIPYFSTLFKKTTGLNPSDFMK
ncbi:MAG: DNA-binding response regulator [Paenibacillaceae bacterium]|nr:MAG: DNA-binding response regulator [Paenibacillaceae bacterium]